MGRLLVTVFLFVGLASVKASAAWIAFVGPCDQRPLTVIETPAHSTSSAGAITLAVLQRSEIPFVGTEQGFASIFGTPTGMDSMEVISDDEMLAYGWCFSVNDHSPEVYPHEYPVNQQDRILWWYGYAHYKRGEWITQCTPAFRRKPAFLCQGPSQFYRPR